MMTTSRYINNVTVAGITGAIGPSIIKSLDAAGFRVQALTRRRQTRFVRNTVNIVEVDYNNNESLREILRGQDAVVSCLGDIPAAVQAQESLLEASLAVGIKRFIPSEFGSDTTNEHVRSYPFFAAKVKHQLRLREAAVANKDFSYSLLITGPFIDWGLSTVPFIINIGARTAEVIDGGNHPFSITRTSTVGAAVSAILLHPNQTSNRPIFIHEGTTTQSTLIAHAQNLLSSRSTSPSPSINNPSLTSPSAFTITNTPSPLAERTAWTAYHAPASNPLTWALPFINLSLWSARELCHFASTDNALLGIPVLEGAQLEALLCGEIEKAAEGFGVLGVGCAGGFLGAEGRARRALEVGKALVCGGDGGGGYGDLERVCEVEVVLE